MELTLERIAEAFIYAAEKNEDSHPAELRFIKRIKSNKNLLVVRLRRTRYILNQLGVMSDFTVADLGCGTALNSILSVMCGASKVYGIEVGEQRFNSAKIIVDYLELTDRIELHNDDLLKVELPTLALHGAFSSELLEHISDLPALYQRLRTWLVDGGKVYARTGANGKNPIKLRWFEKQWELLDKPYQEQREQIIRQRVSIAGEDEIRVLVERTRGLLSEEVVKEAENYVATGKLPPVRKPCAPRNPYTGEYMERTLDPFTVAREIDAQGYETKVLRPDFSCLTLANQVKRTACWAAGQIIRVTHPISLCLAPWIELLSVKR
ncbi:MAG: methyltransferase domain-containing protein [Planctomycetota bacterium]